MEIFPFNSSTKENMDYVLSHLPLEKTTMTPIWARDKILIQTVTQQKTCMI